MGTEIRKVAKNWQHPKDKNGYDKPLYDETFENALNKWEDKKKKMDCRRRPRCRPI